MKKRTIFNFLAVSFLLLSSCAKNSKQVAMFIYAKDDTFIMSLSNHLHNIFKENDITALKYYAERSQSLQNEQITNVIEQNQTDLLIINSVDRLADSAIIEKAKRYNKPIIFYNREPLDRDLPLKGNYYYVGSDFKTEALIQANLVEELFENPNSLNTLYDKNKDGKIQFVMLKGEQGHQDTENRSKYSVEALKDKGYSLDFLTSAYCNWKRDLAKETFASIYKDFGDEIELIIANNDDMALGAIDYLLENKIFSTDVSDVSKQPIQIVGVDATDVAKEAIRNHLMYGTAKNDFKKQADVIFELSSKILNKEEISDSIFSKNHKIYVAGKAISIKNLDD